MFRLSFCPRVFRHSRFVQGHLFDLNIGSNAYNISEVDSNIWKLSEVNNKKKIK